MNGAPNFPKRLEHRFATAGCRKPPVYIRESQRAAHAPPGARARPAPSRASLGRPVTEFWAPADAGNVARAGVAEHAKTLDPA